MKHFEVFLLILSVVSVAGCLRSAPPAPVEEAQPTAALEPPVVGDPEEGMSPCGDECSTKHGFSCHGDPATCTSVCGDGIVAKTEQCDDTNATSGDGCDEQCRTEAGYSCINEPSLCGDADARLSDLLLSSGKFSSPFVPDIMIYEAEKVVDFFAPFVKLTATASSKHATISVNGRPVVSGTESPQVLLSSGDNFISIVVTPQIGDPRTYTVKVIRRSADMLSQSSLSSPSPLANDHLGLSLAGSADTVVVGAPHVDDGTTDTGAVYVSTLLAPGQWSALAKLQAVGLDPGANLGSSVAISGDWIVAGAPLTNSGGMIQSGAVYLAKRDVNGVWSSLTRMEPVVPVDDARFGSSVALDGSTLVVGASREIAIPDSLTSMGVVHVFVHDSSLGWGEEAILPPIPQPEAVSFGASVAISGSTIVVGAPGTAGGGASFVFVRGAGTWSQQQRLQPPCVSTVKSCNFGAAVSAQGERLAVGAPFTSSSGTPFAGKLYVFARSEDNWSTESVNEPTQNEAYSMSGSSVALSGDRVLLGAPGGAAGGAIFYGRDETGRWIDVGKILGSGSMFGDSFGFTVSFASDNILVGAPLRGVDGHDQSGSVYVFGE